jgi:hypothetical protein
MLSDSVLSFNTIHDRVERSEAEVLRHATWLADEMATRAGLDIESPGFAKELWYAAQQCGTSKPSTTFCPKMRTTSSEVCRRFS